MLSLYRRITKDLFLKISEVELPRGVEDRVYNMFLDPTGRHLVISMMSMENYYLSRNSRKAKSLGKFKVRLIPQEGTVFDICYRNV